MQWYIEWTHPNIGKSASTIAGDERVLEDFLADMEEGGAFIEKVVQES